MRSSSTVILDGGIGHLLKQANIVTSVRGVNDESTFAEGAVANIEAPSAVRKVHKDYIEGGADVITCNNFGVTEWSLARVGREADVLQLTEAAALLAREAADSFRGVRVAGSLPPLEESYQPRSQIEVEQMQPVYEQLAGTLAPLVDLLLCETMASAPEAWAAGSAASRACVPLDKPFWLSFTIEDSLGGVLRSGESLEHAAHRIKDLPGLEAVLLNCSAPKAITAALPKLRAALPPHILVGAYGNGFRVSTSEWLTKGAVPGLDVPSGDYDEHGVITPEAYLRYAQQWVELGAAVVGGCCGTGPQHIRRLHDAFKGVQ